VSSRVPADCRLIDTVELYVDESSLTGENHPVNKTGAALGLSPIGAMPPISEQHNIVFMGTLVCSGRGRALVVSVGDYTEFGKVAAQLNEVEQRKSPLQIKIDELGRTLAFASSILIAFIALLGWLMGRPLLETINIAVSLAVAAIPEGLPICVTVTLALGVLRMARAKAIIKKLPVVESLGCANVIASDKTGTLTQNEMTCRIAYTPSFPKWAFAFKGVGYSAKNSAVVKLNGPVSHLSTIDDNIHPSVAYGSSEYDALQALLEAACLCNNASFSETDEEVLLSGQPTEIALLVGAKKMGTNDPRPLYYRLQEIPFTSDRKRMEVRSRPVSNNHSCNAFTLCQQLNSPEHAPTDNSLYFVKGMPEAVIGECVYFTSTDGSLASMSDGARAHALSQSRQMASLGLRVLAIAYGEESLYFY
jgi:Ca2+-transporting ATPase